jgi:hypothetical protein
LRPMTNEPHLRDRVQKCVKPKWLLIEWPKGELGGAHRVAPGSIDTPGLLTHP